MIKNGGKYMMV